MDLVILHSQLRLRQEKDTLRKERTKSISLDDNHVTIFYLAGFCLIAPFTCLLIEMLLEVDVKAVAALALRKFRSGIIFINYYVIKYFFRFQSKIVNIIAIKSS